MRPLIQLFGLLLAPAAQRFHWALTHPQQAQQRIQKALCDRLIASEYGQSLGIQSQADWHRIPIVTYDDLQPWIARSHQNPHSNLSRSPLTPEPIVFYEPTSGSQGAVKWIPYTQSLRRSFNHLFCIWAADLIQNGPRFSTGKLYFSISPHLDPPPDLAASSSPSLTTQFPLDGVPLGDSDRLATDAEYLDRWLRIILRPFWVSLPHLPSIRDPEHFKEHLCLTLLAEKNLEIVSIWSPSFLQGLLDYIQTHRTRLQSLLPPDRAHLLAQPNLHWPSLWPKLKLISCWDNCCAADSAEGLRSHFPGTLVQGKGLLATEAPMTIPLIAAGGCVPLLDEVFFEFEDEAGQIYSLTQLQSQTPYSIVLSQKGGLYRYRMGDRVQVTHWYHQTPCLEFLGRDQSTSDLVGEKLHESFVAKAIEQLGLPATVFKCLIPIAGSPAYYLLVLDQSPPSPDSLLQQLDKLLGESFHYRQARSLGQLAPVQLWVSPQFPDLFRQKQLQLGKSWGGLKYPLLLAPTQVPVCMEGETLPMGNTPRPHM